MYYKWSKVFLETGKCQLNGYTIREASSSEVANLRGENEQIKQLAVNLILKNRVLKKV
jgi:transposase